MVMAGMRDYTGVAVIRRQLYMLNRRAEAGNYRNEAKVTSRIIEDDEDDEDKQAEQSIRCANKRGGR